MHQRNGFPFNSLPLPRIHLEIYFRLRNAGACPTRHALQLPPLPLISGYKRKMRATEGETKITVFGNEL